MGNVAPVLERAGQSGSDRCVWEIPGSRLAVRLRLDVVEKIERDALESFRAITKKGSEIGGLLLGTISDDRSGVMVEDCLPIVCDYTRGPLYQLAEADEQRFAKAVDNLGSLLVVGFYRSNTRKDFRLDENDIALIERYLPSPETLALLVRPFSMKPCTAGLFQRSAGLSPAQPPALEFTFRRSELLKAGGSPPVPPAPQKAAEIVAEALRAIEKAMPPAPAPAPVKHEFVVAQHRPEPDPVAPELTDPDPVSVRFNPVPAPPEPLFDEPDPVPVDPDPVFVASVPAPAATSTEPLPQETAEEAEVELPEVAEITPFPARESEPPAPPRRRLAAVTTLRSSAAPEPVPEEPVAEIPRPRLAAVAQVWPEPAPAPVEVPVPSFGQHEEQRRSHRWLWLPLLLIPLGAGGYFGYEKLQQQPKSATAQTTQVFTPTLMLRVERSGGQLVLTWNQASPAVVAAGKASLTIIDGSQTQEVEVDLTQLRTGSLVYAPSTGDVTFRLHVTEGVSGKVTTESIRSLVGRPSPMSPPTPQPVAVKSAPVPAAPPPAELKEAPAPKAPEQAAGEESPAEQ